MTPPGQPAIYRPINPAAPVGNQGAGQGAGAFRHPAQVAQPYNVAPRDVEPHNEAPNAPARAQQAVGEQPARKRLADGRPQQPAAKKHARGRATARAPSEQLSSTGQPPSGQPSTGASEHQLSISERLDRDLITDVAGLTRAEENEVLLWARRRGMRWNDIYKKFNFKGALSTLRGRHRDLMYHRKPPKVAKFGKIDVTYQPFLLFSHVAV